MTTNQFLSHTQQVVAAILSSAKEEIHCSSYSPSASFALLVSVDGVLSQEANFFIKHVALSEISHQIEKCTMVQSCGWDIGVGNGVGVIFNIMK